MLRLTFLGTSAAQPTVARNLSGLALRREPELVLFDCGEGTQRQMIRYGTGFDVAAIFFTHFHADHYLGAIGFLRTLSMQGRQAPLDLYGPRPARRILDAMLFTGTEPFTFHARLHEVAPGEAVTVGDRVIRPEEVVDAPRRGRRVVVTGDTRPCAGTVEAARGADLLVHDSTFGDAEEARARETMHSTAREAGRVAREAGAERLVLTHLSTRYDREPEVLVAQAAEEHPAVSVAHDGLVLEVERPA